MSTLFNEYRNQHAHRAYPFADDTTLSAAGGTVLPVDYFIDAFLYPIDLVGAPYLAELSTSGRTLVVRDTETGQIIGTATWAQGDAVAEVVDMSGFARALGMFVLGPAAEFQSSEDPMIFEPAAATLAPSAFMPLNQDGVRGISDDMNNLVTGAIKFEGANGVHVHTYESGGKAIIRIDVYGELPDLDCKNCTPIEQIKIENVDCTPIVGSSGGAGTLIISGQFGLDALCPPANIGEPTKDPCAPEPPAPEWECPEDSYFVVPIVNGRLEIVTPSTLVLDNPVRVISEPNPIAPVDMGDLARIGDNLDDIRRRLDWLVASNAYPGGNVKIALRSKL